MSLAVNGVHQVTKRLAIALTVALLAPACASQVEPAAAASPIRYAIDPAMAHPEMVQRAAAEWNEALGIEVFRQVEPSATEPHLTVTLLPANEHPGYVGWTVGGRSKASDPSTTVGTMKIREGAIGVMADHYRLGVYVHEFGHSLALEHEDADDSVMHAPLLEGWTISDASLDGAEKAMGMR